MTYKEARVYLDEVSKYGSVLGLDTIRGLLRELSNPQDDLKFIHIAGTNGKGSVLAYTSTILSEAGYKTGRYVSPTVVSYLERIQVDGQWIPKEEFAELVEEVQKAIARMETLGEASPTVFEVETAIAFLYFKKMKCDVVVLETGLGGTLDATNIVENTIAAVFASISRDHMGFLGDTLEEIAQNKAGIIKPGCFAVTAVQKPEVMKVLKDKADECSVRMYTADLANVNIIKEGWDGQRFSYGDWKNIEIGLAGSYQIMNAVTVLRLMEGLNENGFLVPEKAVRDGFQKAVWPGRFTCIGRKPLFIIDGAHNEDAAKQLKASVERYFPEQELILIMGVFKDKEYDKIAQIMAPLAKTIYTVDLPDEVRTLKAEELKEAVKPYCKDAEAVSDILCAVDRAYESAKEEDVILAFGSLSYLGQVMQLVELRKEKS